MNKFKITTDNEGFNKMVEASLLSIARRQDRHSTGAIPESDLDVDNGFSYKFAGGGGKRYLYTKRYRARLGSCGHG